MTSREINDRQRVIALALARVKRVLEWSQRFSATNKNLERFYAEESANMILLASLVGRNPKSWPSVKRLVNTMRQIYLRKPAGDHCSAQLALQDNWTNYSCMVNVPVPGWDKLLTEQKRRLPWKTATTAITLTWIKNVNDDKTIVRGVQYCRKYLPALSLPLAFQKTGGLTDESSYRVYLITHLVFCASAYGSQEVKPPLMQFYELLPLLQRWIIQISFKGPLFITKNLEELIELICSALIVSKASRQPLHGQVWSTIDLLERYLIQRVKRSPLPILYAKPGKFPFPFMNINPSNWRNPLHVDYHSSVLVALFLTLL